MWKMRAGAAPVVPLARYIKPQLSLGDLSVPTEMDVTVRAAPCVLVEDPQQSCRLSGNSCT